MIKNILFLPSLLVVVHATSGQNCHVIYRDTNGTNTTHNAHWNHALIIGTQKCVRQK
ncbi:MAG: hypothetical protein H7Z21_18445 [Hymenobacter sp.]|nr:hypothetical protein [Hymenobacter sp.]